MKSLKTILTKIALLGAIATSFTSPACAVQVNEPELANAAERSQWHRVQILLDHGADVNASQVDGMTALHWATWHDQTDAALKLLAHGAQVNKANRYGVHPLSLACQNGNGKLTARFLRAGADPNTSLPGGETALMTASRNGRLLPVKELLEAGAEVNAKEHRGQTAMMWAAAEGHADVVALLIKSGADIDVTLNSGFTSLTLAAREGKLSTIRVLIEAGADINAAMQPKSGGGRLPRNGMSPLMVAIENGHFELAAWLLESGANPNDERSGFRPLHAITWVRKPNLGDGLDGTPPPIGSGSLTSLELVRVLARRGADVNARLKRGRSGRGRLNHHGATPFLMAADTADLPLMKLLLELGADPKIPNADHCPPLLAAAGVGTLAPGEEAGTPEEALAAVRLLLELGADINAVDANGETAMHGAAYKSLPDMVRLLSDRGADIQLWNKKNKYGWTPLMLAEGHRPGNFKPAAATIGAVRAAMRAAGVEPPQDPTPRVKRRGYEDPTVDRAAQAEPPKDEPKKPTRNAKEMGSKSNSK